MCLEILYINITNDTPVSLFPESMIDTNVVNKTSQETNPKSSFFNSVLSVEVIRNYESKESCFFEEYSDSEQTINSE